MEGTFGHKLGLELRVCKPLVSVRRWIRIENGNPG